MPCSGENGAGKTTLMHIADGLLQPDAGVILAAGVPVRFRSARDARRHGIGLVHQHSTAVPALSVAENIALAAGWPVAPGGACIGVLANSASGSRFPSTPPCPPAG